MPDTLPICDSLSELTAQISDWSNRKGWWDAQPVPTFLEKSCLFHAEISEANEEYRKYGLDPEKFIYFGPSDAVSGTDVDEASERCPQGRASGERVDEGRPERNIHLKPEGIAVELADTVIRILDACAHWKIPLAEAIAVKMAYNEKRPYRHGGKLA